MLAIAIGILLIVFSLVRFSAKRVTPAPTHEAIAKAPRNVFSGIPDADAALIPDANLGGPSDAKLVVPDVKPANVEIAMDPDFVPVQHQRARYVKHFRTTHPRFAGSDVAIYTAMMKSTSDSPDIDVVIEQSLDAEASKPIRLRTGVGSKAPFKLNIASPEQLATIDAPLAQAETASNHDRRNAVLMYVLSGAAAGGAIASGIHSQSIFNELHRDILKNNPRILGSDPRFTKGAIYAIAADLAYGVAGVSLLAALYYTFRHRDEAQPAAEQPFAVVPSIAPGYAGVDVLFRW